MTVGTSGPTTGSLDRDYAVAEFLDLVESHRVKSDETRRLVEQVYDFQTPDRPVFQFQVKGYEYEKSEWVRSRRDELLDHNIQTNRYQMESLPQNDYVPMLYPIKGKSDLIGTMFGGEYDHPEEGGAVNVRHVISDIERDVPRLPELDPASTSQGAKVIDDACFLAEATQGKMLMVYPHMMGFLTNAWQMMDHMEMLMACRTNQTAMRAFVNLVSRVMCRMILALQQALGASSLRPRGLYSPEWVRGIVVDDYVSIIRPDDYYAICAEGFQTMHDAVGPIYLHTCGPVAQCTDVLARLPGLKGFETVFVQGQSKTTSELLELKAPFKGRTVVHALELPWVHDVESYDNPIPVTDPENFTAEWLRDVNEGGGFMIMTMGAAEQGKELRRRLELD